jgi:hypothetical protein
MKRALFLVGHTKMSAGALAYNHVPEWIFNYGVLLAMQDIHAAKTPTFSATFKTRMTWELLEKELAAEPRYDASIELHFNSFAKEAYGCEALALAYNAPSIALAEHVANKIWLKHKIKKRNGDGVVEIFPASRGNNNLMVVSKYAAAAIIVEPCFANFPTREAKEIIDSPKEYAHTIYDAMERFLK